VSQAESSEEEGDIEAISHVSDKMEELSRMKARLAQLQAMVSAVNNGDVTPHVSQNQFAICVNMNNCVMCPGNCEIYINK
jgi:nitrate reductase cytochrome c-type subunit